jgi:hypothetical protein
MVIRSSNFCETSRSDSRPSSQPTLAAAPALRLKFWTLAQAQGRTEMVAAQGRPLKNGLVLLIFDMLMMLLKSFMLVRLPIGDN